MILVIDTEPRWIAYWQAKGADTCSTIDAALGLIDSRPRYDRVIISALLLSSLPRIAERNAQVEVVTANPSLKEQIAAYRAGAVDYRIKEFAK